MFHKKSEQIIPWTCAKPSSLLYRGITLVVSESDELLTFFKYQMSTVILTVIKIGCGQSCDIKQKF